MSLSVEDLDHENLDYFKYCAAARLPSAEMRRLLAAALPADHGLPVVFQSAIDMDRGGGEGRGAFLRRGAPRHSAGVQGQDALYGPAGRPRHAEAASRRRVRGVAGRGQSGDTRMASWRRPDAVSSVGIGTRVRMVFADVADGLALPQWTIDETASQPQKPWRYPQE